MVTLPRARGLWVTLLSMMNMQSRNQYLLTLIEKRGYHTLPKKEKSKMLDEYCATTGQARNYVIRKIRSGAYLEKKGEKKKRIKKHYYDGKVREALARCWEIFDYPCGQRLESLLKREVGRLRLLDELICSDEVAKKLKEIDFRTIDEKLKREKEAMKLKRKYHKKIHPLLYRKIPVKVFSEQDRTKEGTVQIDLVEHCGASASGEFIYTLSATDIATQWHEGEAVMGKSQKRVSEGLREARARFPFPWKEMHSDGGTEFINDHLYRISLQERISFSRSRPYKKNDNCLVEQKNWTHVRKLVGYYRYDTRKEQDLLNDLYRSEQRLFKNFFQPVMKLISKERIGGKIKRKYDIPKTPYQRVMESPDVSEEVKRELTRLYRSLNPAQLKRTIDAKLALLYQAYQAKHSHAREAQTNTQMVKLSPKLTPRTLTFLHHSTEGISLT